MFHVKLIKVFHLDYEPAFVPHDKVKQWQDTCIPVIGVLVDICTQAKSKQRCELSANPEEFNAY